MRSKQTRIRLMATLALCTAPCCAGTDPSTEQQSEEAAEPWTNRVPIQESAFTPTALEQAIEEAADALNSEERPERLVFGILPKTTDGYFAPATLGANRALGELGILGVVHGPTTETSMTDEESLAWQRALMQRQIEERYDGIGVAPYNREVVPDIDAAVAEKITVLTFDSDEPNSNRHFYIGTDNTKAGRTAGQTMIDLVDPPGTVVVFGYDQQDWTDGRSRTLGAVEVMRDAGFSVTVRGASWIEAEDLDSLETALLEADPPAVGMLGVFSNSHLCVDAAISAGVIDQVTIAAFDFQPETLAYMREGRIEVTHGQRQYYMGYFIPYVLIASALFGVEETKALFSDVMVSDGVIDTGLDIVDADALPAYSDYLSSLGLLSFW